jgi:hypothetical protein
MSGNITEARLGFLLLAALFAFPATAHIPHDGALFAATWPGGDRPLLTTIYRDSGILLCRMGEQPGELDVRFMTPQKADIRTVVYVDTDRLIAAAASEGLWISGDLGDSWAPHPDLAQEDFVGVVSASPSIDTDGLALVGAATGIWRSANQGIDWTQVQTSAQVQAIAWSNTWDETPTVCALDSDSNVTCSTDLGLSWTFHSTATRPLTDIAVQGAETLWGASASGVLHSRDGFT